MSPVFGHGQLRLYLLALLDDGPRHGYEVMRDLEERFHGLYSPSAGTVYPRLAKLEEEGLVERTSNGRKTTYSLTEQGRAEVAARSEEMGDLEQDLDRSAHELAQEVRSRVHGQSSDLRSELKAAAKAARRSATPISSDSWSAPEGTLEAQIEHAVHDLRRAARRIARARDASDEVRRDVLTIVETARDQLRHLR